MPDQIYKPGFQLPNWRDNIDRVSADGPNGFNIQFVRLSKELEQISAQFKDVYDQIAKVGTPPPTQVTITFTPTLTATDTTPWTHQPGLAVKPLNATSAHGMMSVNLPSGVRVLTLRVSGQNSDSTGRNAANGSLFARLLRQSRLLDGTSPDTMVTVQGSGRGSVVTFDTPDNIDTNFARIDNNHKYFITAQLDNAAVNDIVQISSFQISYMTA